MSFFGNTKIMGLVIIVAGIISLIGGIIAAVTAIMQIDDLGDAAPQILKAIGALVVGIGLLWCGINIRKASDGSAALRIFVRVFGLIVIVNAVLGLIGAIIGKEDLGLAGFIIALIIGLIILWVGNKIAGKNKNVLSKLLWIILIVVFIILAISQLVTLLGLDFNADGALGALIMCICMFIAYLCALVLCFSDDVKKAML